ncbi:lysozyme [uncultured Caudovirales phage]|uniref:Lysozyme n=1 Tax=uncultured Caudovirales phage TaxID=2100421 RepID=A0A6J5N767_9CAUD|nr:lysozyme [uncultured Caudovirales phage]
MIKRTDWGAKPLTAYSTRIDPTYRTGVVIHHSVTSEGKSQKDVEAILRMIDGLHRSKGYGGIGYNIAVDYAGRVYEARGVNTIGAHVVNANGHNYGIVYIGDGRERITDEAVEAIQGLVNKLQVNSKKKLKVYGHQELWATACPGPKIQKLVANGKFDFPYDPPRQYVTAGPGDTYRKIARRQLGIAAGVNPIKVTKEAQRIRALNDDKPITTGMKVRVK